jgi:hypothetical protein
MNSNTRRFFKTQKAMTGDRKGADTLSDIMIAKRQGRLPKNVFFEDKGKPRVDLDKAAQWLKDH